MLIFSISHPLSNFSASEQFVPADRPVSAYGFRPDEPFFYNYSATAQ